MNLSMKQKQNHGTENRLVVAERLGLADVSFYIYICNG